MNISIRKLAMLEKSILEKEEESRMLGYASCPIDKDMKERVSLLMNKIRSM